MNIRVALTFRSLLLASVVLAGVKADSVLAQPAAKPTLKPPPATPTPDSADGSEDRTDLPDIKPFETGIDYKPTSPRTKVTFNLEDADLPDLVRLVSQITGKRFILPAKGRSVKATVYAPTKVTAAEAYQAFLSILELNGMALVPSGSYMKIVESGRVEGRPIPLYTEGDIPRGDRFITRLHRVEHIAAEDAAQLLERFKSGDGSMTAYAPTNTLIITDTGTNLRRMMRILNAIDVARTGQQVWVEPVHHATASELASQLSEIFDTDAAGSDANKPNTATKPTPRKPAARNPAAANASGGVTTIGSGGAAESRITKILADERTNSLIIVATEAAYLRILEMLKHLDSSLQGEGRIHVHHLQHSDAEEVASTLSSLVGGSGGSSASSSSRLPPSRRGPTTSSDVGSIFEGKVAVTAHTPANSLVITSSTHDYAALRHVIDELDVERRQVFIEAVIMELSVNRSSELGISYHGGLPDVPSDGSLALTGFDALSSLSLQSTETALAQGDMLSGFAVGIRGPELVGFNWPSFGVAITALSNNQDANVLSTPHLIAMDNVEAEISIGQNVPLQTSAPALGGGGGLGGLAGLAGLGAASGLSGAGGLGALSSLGGGLGFGGSVPRQDVGTTLTITPHINDSNDIRLEIAEEISEAGPPSDTGNLGVVPINRTQAKTEVVVRDQETVVIGGLMRDGVTSTVRKVPILGDIPLLGALFRSTTKNKTKRNLLLFLTPYIIRSPSDLRSIYERKIRERQEFLDRYFVAETDEYEPPTDYSRTRGLLGEMIVELDRLQEERDLIAEAARKPELTHAPRPAVGQAAPAELMDEEGLDGEDVMVIDERSAGTEAGTEAVQEPSAQPVPGGIPPIEEMQGGEVYQPAAPSPDEIEGE